MEADSYSALLKDTAYQVCDLIRSRNMSDSHALEFFNQEMKKKLPKLSETELKNLYSYGMFVTR